jgi:hypothetical protein
MLPFTAEQFFAVFEAWNRAVEPLPFIAYPFGIALLIAAIAGGRNAGPLISVVLALLWMIMGLGYHVTYFASINTAAYFFGALFVVQAGLLLNDARTGASIRFERRRRIDLRSGVGLLWAVYGLAGYSFASMAAGHAYPRVPVFGTAPCPTVIFTLGLLMMTRPPARWRLYVIPLIWSVIGGSAAILLAVPQDYGLIVAGLCAAGLLLLRRPSRETRP